MKKEGRESKSRRLHIAIQPTLLELIHDAAQADGWDSASAWIRHVLMAAAKTALEKDANGLH